MLTNMLLYHPKIFPLNWLKTKPKKRHFPQKSIYVYNLRYVAGQKMFKEPPRKCFWLKSKLSQHNFFSVGVLKHQFDNTLK